MTRAGNVKLALIAASVAELVTLSAMLSTDP
jgi:hypothetical protein